MGLFQRKITDSTDLSRLPTDRLLREHAAAKRAWAAFMEASARAEFTRTIDPSLMLKGVEGAGLKGRIEEELKRRGLVPPS